MRSPHQVALCAVVLILICLVSAFGQKPGKIETSYDKFKDRTTIETDYMRVYGSDWNSNPLEIAARTNYRGKTPRQPVGVILYFYSATKNWRFKTEPALLVIADGERINLGTATIVDQEIHSDRYSVSVREYLSLVVTFETFQKIAHASSVEMQLGSLEFSLNDKTLATFRELVRRAQATN